MSKYPSKTKELPTSAFFAILYPTSVTIPGDERSRTNPGHGYPEHTVSGWSIETFPNREEWEEKVKELGGRVYPKEFKAVQILPFATKQTISIEIEQE